MSVWKRVRKYAQEIVTSIIHGKAEHEETKATSFARARRRAAGITSWSSRWRTPITSAITSGTAATRRSSWRNSGTVRIRRGLIPICICRRVGVANQTTMLRGETEEVQRRIRQAIVDRDGPELGATEFPLLRHDLRRHAGTAGRACANCSMCRMDLLLVVGGYNSSNTSHLAEMGEEKAADLFRPQRLAVGVGQEILHYDSAREAGSDCEGLAAGSGPIVVGITAGASCPNNLIEETLVRLFELRGIKREELEAAA